MGWRSFRRIVAAVIEGGTITGALIRTAVTGQRVELGGAAPDRVSFYSGRPIETAPGRIAAYYTGGTLSGLEIIAPLIADLLNSARITLPSDSEQPIIVGPWGTIRLDAAVSTTITGNASVGGVLSAAGAVTAQNGVTVSGGNLTVSTGNVTVSSGNLTLSASGSKVRRGALVAPALQNGWVPFGAPFQPPRYCEMPDHTALLCGVVKNGTIGATMFTLPAAVRPASDHSFLAGGDTRLRAQVTVRSSGEVECLSADAGLTWLTLDGIQWPIAGFNA